MSKVKTCVVFLKFRMNGDDFTWKDVVECAKFGDGEEYETAYDFIQAVKTLHRSNGSVMLITNVVIG